MLLNLLFTFSLAHADRDAYEVGNDQPSYVAENSTFDVTKFGLNKKCEGFIKPNGDLGPWGKSLEEALHGRDKGCFYGRPLNYTGICPKFNDFTEEQKTQFFAFVFAVIANGEGSPQHPESQCDDWQQQNQAAPYGGLLRLPHQNKERIPLARTRNACNIRFFNFRDTAYQMKCGASVFANYYCDKSFKFSAFLPLWKSLQTRKAFDTIAKFPLCR